MASGRHVTRTDAPFEATMERLAARLTVSLPGPDSMLRMAAPDRGVVTPEEARRKGADRAAALVLLYPGPDTESASVALTTRAADLRHHGGQVSFPGGRIDEGEDPVQAALREAWEELAVPSDVVHVIGLMSPLYIPPSGFLVQPVVAWCHMRPTFRANPSEVSSVIEAPVSTFVGRAHRREEWRKRGGKPRLTPYFALPPHKVWGATAMMLAELGSLWSDIMGDVEQAAARGGAP